jgi:type I restriction enzyme R subunit
VEGISGERTNRLRLLVLAEALTEEQLAIYDLLMRPSPELTDTERSQVKWVAESLLEALKRQKPDELPKKFTRELYVEKCDVVYQHVSESYWDDGQSIYDRAV